MVEITNAILKGKLDIKDEAPPSDTNVDLGSSLDIGEKTDQEVSIEEAADAFVESDENLNQEIEKQNAYKISGRSGYPYVD